MRPSNAIAAAEGWPAGVPDWVTALAAACDARSQSRVAEALGVSASAVNAVVRGRYGANTARIEQIVRGRLMAAVVACPVLGQLATDLCQEWQGKATKFADSSSLRTRMARACRDCPHSRLHQEDRR